jgi:hypothetical protein
MRVRKRVYKIMVATAAVLMTVFLGSRGVSVPLTLEFVGLTNIPPTVAARPLWTALDAQGEVSNLTAAAPSHVLFKVRNQTRSSLPFRPLLYQFADSLLAGVALPAGPSRHRGGRADGLPRELNGYKGMSFGPPECEIFGLRTLAPGEFALVTLPRPPFDCVWRAAVGYELPLTPPETVRHMLKQWLHIPETHNIIGAAPGFAYDECIYGAWITNTLSSL